MSDNQNAAVGQSAGRFNFSEVFWQKTGMLLVFYWLFRLLCPSILPESLQTANFQMQMLVCGTGGFVFTILAALGRAGATAAKTGQK